MIEGRGKWSRSPGQCGGSDHASGETHEDREGNRPFGMNKLFETEGLGDHLHDSHVKPEQHHQNHGVKKADPQCIEAEILSPQHAGQKNPEEIIHPVAEE